MKITIMMLILAMIITFIEYLLHNVHKIYIENSQKASNNIMNEYKHLGDYL